MSRQSMRKGEVMITVSPMAEGKIRALMQEEQDTIGLRVFVKGGGCHGYQYGMSFETKMSEDDTVVEKGDVKIIMDSQSAPMLARHSVSRRVRRHLAACASVRPVR